jgi:hypothetical protein
MYYKGHGEIKVHGDGVICFLCVVCCCVIERQLVLGCLPLVYGILYYGIIVGVGISIVVLDTYAILVKYLAREYGRREKNDKSVVLYVLCVVKNSYLLQQFYQHQI